MGYCIDCKYCKWDDDGGYCLIEKCKDIDEIQSLSRKAAEEIVENRDNLDSMYLGVEEIADLIASHFSEGE